MKKTRGGTELELSAENLAALGPMTRDELLAVMGGEPLEDARKRLALKAELCEESQRYLNAPPTQWPQLIFNWDLSPDGQRFALDGVNPCEFLKQYPEGLILGWVDFEDFDSKLRDHSRRDDGELWSVGDGGKLAKAIAYLSRGLPITPPLIAPAKGKGELAFVGGNHRYAAFKAVSAGCELPIYVSPGDFDIVARIVNVRAVQDLK